ncbi:hypothetical protein [Nocardioides dongkuii]|uniref:hypothetical protein n=1 Tax=Nocardioides dongkuii TaxID=2760089 RepID=UPI0015FB1E69|nr:hypothetical protein [Nocardioides dongkuii]
MKSTILAAGVLGAAALLTGCGGDDDGDNGNKGGSDASSFTDQSAVDIVTEAKDAMGTLESVKVSGSIDTDGEEVALDLAMNTEGTCEGSVSIDGANLELLGVDGTTWFKPDEAFWRQQAGEQAEMVMKTVGDRWVVVPAGEGGFSELCDLDSLLDQMLSDSDEDEDSYEKGDVEDVDGTEAIAITNVDAEDGDSIGYVAVEGEHYLLKMEQKDTDEPGSITFSDFDAELAVEPPADDEVFDLEQMAG